MWFDVSQDGADQGCVRASGYGAWPFPIPLSELLRQVCGLAHSIVGRCLRQVPALSTYGSDHMGPEALPDQFLAGAETVARLQPVAL